MVDAEYADKVVAVTDCLVPFPNIPASISMTNVDYVCVVDAIGNPEKIATGAAKPTTDVRKLMMADYCTQFVINTPYFKDGFSYQTGVGGASIASTISLGKIMEERGIQMGLGARRNYDAYVPAAGEGLNQNSGRYAGFRYGSHRVD